MSFRRLCCESCRNFREYKDFDCYEENRIMSEGLCYDPDPVDNNMPRFKLDWCEHYEVRK